MKCLHQETSVHKNDCLSQANSLKKLKLIIGVALNTTGIVCFQCPHVYEFQSHKKHTKPALHEESDIFQSSSCMKYQLKQQHDFEDIVTDLKSKRIFSRYSEVLKCLQVRIWKWFCPFAFTPDHQILEEVGQTNCGNHLHSIWPGSIRNSSASKTLLLHPLCQSMNTGDRFQMLRS